MSRTSLPACLEGFLYSFAPAIRDQIISIYTRSLERSWEIAVIFAGIALLSTFVEKELKLRTELDTEFGLQETKQDTQVEEARSSRDAWEATTTDYHSVEHS